MSHALRSHCRDGHVFTPGTTITDRSTGRRRCRICRNAKARRRWAAQHAALYAERAQRAQRQEKRCTGCKLEKPLNDFSPNRACIDGRKARCRQCEREYAALFRKENPERVRATERKFYASHHERINAKAKRWHDLNKNNVGHRKRAVARAAAWARQNPDRAKVHKENHRAAKLRAIPTWANSDEMQAIYQAARLLGPGFHVDHIVPLQGETVCGLHCEANLQIIPSSVNIAKRNRHWPDMFKGAEA